MSEDERTRLWQRSPAPASGGTDSFDLLRGCLARVRAAPDDPEARRLLRATAAEQGDWEELALLLADEVRAAGRPAVRAAFLEELVDVYENLGRAPETIATMESLVELAPDDLGHLDRLAQLYDRAGSWAKAAETFERVARLAPAGQARAALRACARIYRAHARPERAVVAYQLIASRYPTDLEAWRALDELLAELGRWEALADVRAALAARAENGVEKAAALRAQARALEQAGKAEKAAALVMQASLLAPEEVSGIVDYAAVLARGGRGDEAVDLLKARVAAAVADGAPPDSVAALRLRLAGVLEDGCRDRVAASAVLEELLADAPRYVPALEFLVWQAAQDPDPRVHAFALLRNADALPAGPDKAGLLADAGRRFRDAGERARAVRAFEQACQLVDDPDVVRERDEARAAELVERAGIEAKSGAGAAAEARLRTLLDSRPHDVDANLALATLFVDRGDPDVAAEHLRATLAAVPGGPGKPHARVVHRLAEIVASRGGADEAHQLLHEAHRLDRKDLLITLALGDSCFARRLWREAALHLGSLAEHPDAPAHARAVAAGLVRAAQADVRSLRPGNKEMRYAAAVRIDPQCAPAWHALAEIATERGDTEGVATYLENEAAATTDPRDRVRLYDALGDLARDVLGDPARAERCWAQVADAGSAQVLDKLLGLLRKRGAGVERAEACERLAALRTDPRAKKELIEEAIDAYLAGGEVERARAAADRLVEAHPVDTAAVAAATAVTVAAGDHGTTAAWLGRALAGGEAADGGEGDGDPRLAELWRRLGDARRHTGDSTGARAAYERAIAIAPESDGALAARRGLVGLAGATGGPIADSLAVLVEAEHDPADILALARERATSAARIGPTPARVLYALAQSLGARLSSADHAYVERHRVRAMASDQAYPVVLDDAKRRALIDDDADAPLAAVFDALAEVAPLLCPGAAAALAQAGLTGCERLSSASPVAAASLYPQIANALAGPTTLLYAAPRAEYLDLTLLRATPPVIVLGARLAKLRAQSKSEIDSNDDAVLRFRLGRAVELARPRRLFAATDKEGSFARLVDGLWYALARPDEEPADPDVAAEAKRLRSTIPLMVRRKLAEQLAALSRDALDPARYIAACDRAADRAGMIACGDVAVALELASGDGRHLVKLAASPRFHAVRAAMWPLATEA